jgi:hypothetical protein
VLVFFSELTLGDARRQWSVSGDFVNLKNLIIGPVFRRYS